MKLLIGNFKNKLDKKQNEEYSKILDDISINEYNLVIAPSNPFLYIYRGSSYKLASQDISSYIDETITGEITGNQLKSLGCQYVIVGHSERRNYCGEININFINKINNAQESGLEVIYCVGESLSDYQNGRTFEVLKKQINEVLNNVDTRKIIIAYEPTYAIGAKESLNKEKIIEIINYIKDITFEQYETNFKILYGGGIDKEKIKILKKEKVIDGFLIGSSSFNYNDFLDIINELNK